MPVDSHPAATVVIVTKNRVDELRRAVASALEQSAPLEVVVIDDGSTDGTADVVTRDFPEARLYRSEQSRGCVVQRNRGATLARAPIVFSLDDDAVLTSSTTVSDTLAEFDDGRIAAVAIPMTDQTVPVTASDGKGPIIVLPTFIGAAHALRRDLFLAIGGFREHLVHWGEERDLAIRLLDAGYWVRAGRAAPVHHVGSPIRDLSRTAVFARRNDVIFAWQNVPLPWLLLHVPASFFRGIGIGLRYGGLGPMLRGFVKGIVESLRRYDSRRPVGQRTYLSYRRLARAGGMPLDSIPSPSHKP